MSVRNVGGSGAGGGALLYTPTKTANYTAVANDFVRVSTAGGVATVTLPTPTANAQVGVLSTDGTGALPATVSGGAAPILGPGVAAAATSILLGSVGAYVILQGDGANWRIIDGQQDSGWIAVTVFTNGWANNGGPISYRLTGNVVRFKGLLTLGTNSTSAFTLPAGYRPPGAYNPILALGNLTGTAWAQVVGSTGAFTVGSSNANTSIDGVTYTVD